MEQQTEGTVVSVSTQWWCKVNRRPVRLHPLDGAVFPHIVKIQYMAEGKSRACRKWLGAGAGAPGVGSRVRVFYPAGKPSKARVEL